MITKVEGFRTSDGAFFENEDMARLVEAKMQATAAIEKSLYFSNLMTVPSIISLVMENGEVFMQLILAHIDFEAAQNVAIEPSAHEQSELDEMTKVSTRNAAHDPQQNAPQAKDEAAPDKRRT